MRLSGLGFKGLRGLFCRGAGDSLKIVVESGKDASGVFDTVLKVFPPRYTYSKSTFPEPQVVAEAERTKSNLAEASRNQSREGWGLGFWFRGLEVSSPSFKRFVWLQLCSLSHLSSKA